MSDECGSLSVRLVNQLNEPLIINEKLQAAIFKFLMP